MKGLPRIYFLHNAIRRSGTSIEHSNEDGVPFKPIAGCDENVDTDMLVQAGPNYDVSRAELVAQIDRSDDDQVATFANEGSVDRAERTG
ncbi:hypothetical protein [Natrinema salaciae]|uniref:hypothetical protein n=1 Tax=Natrinema salaciae TaxID=1186196 RepID=UPI000B836D1D|nr:hypothetical protein [Natrinema salaciae]